jgi:hypothetical protein
MTAILFLVGVIAVCVLGAVYGADSRHVDTNDHRRNI